MQKLGWTMNTGQPVKILYAYSILIQNVIRRFGVGEYTESDFVISWFRN